MTESDRSTPSREEIIVVEKLIIEGADADQEGGPRQRSAGAYDDSAELTFAELVELWHHQHNVAMHKERLYVPSSLAVLVGTILGWKDLTPVVVLLAAVVSVGVYWYLVLILDDFGARQDRFFVEMQRRRRNVLKVMFNESRHRFAHESEFIGPPTVQRRLRRPFVATLIGVWLGLFLVKLGLFKSFIP